MQPTYTQLRYFTAVFDIHTGHLATTSLSKKGVTRLTEHVDVIEPLLREAPPLGLALGPAPPRAGPV